MLKWGYAFLRKLRQNGFARRQYEPDAESLQSLLHILPEDTEIYPGHGEATDAAFEKRNNPYL